jgi:hypothetical protein
MQPTASATFGSLQQQQQFELVRLHAGRQRRHRRFGTGPAAASPAPAVRCVFARRGRIWLAAAAVFNDDEWWHRNGNGAAAEQNLKLWKRRKSKAKKHYQSTLMPKIRTAKKFENFGIDLED